MDTIVERVYSRLKTDVTNCTINPGQRIVQSKLAKDYGVGLTPIREALHRLIQEGLVRVEPRRGYIVSPINLSEINELYEYRIILEIGAVKLAIERGSYSDLQKIMDNANFTYCYGDHASYSQFLQYNTIFHKSIALASKNYILAVSLETVLDRLSRVNYLAIDIVDNAEEICREHKELAAAIIAREFTKAEESLKAQVNRSLNKITNTLINTNSLKAQKMRLFIVVESAEENQYLKKLGRT